MSTVFFTSDWHLNHENIIKYSNRPFSSASEMNEALLNNYNSKVGPRDAVWFLGDLLMGRDPVEEARKFLPRMNGIKHMILGNHDPRKQAFYDLFESCSEYREIKVQGQRITLCHYAARAWHKSHRGAWMLYGHSHGSLPDDPNARSLDVGVDCHKYFPLSFEEVGALMARKNYVAVDHHRENPEE